MPDLLRWPAPATLRRITGAAFLLTALIFIVFNIHDRPLAPYNIVTLELAWTPARAAELFAAWGERGIQVARESLWIDFLYMPAYALMFAGLALAEARLARGGWRTAGRWLALAPFGAWAFDLAENLALLRVLHSPAAPPAGLLTLAGVAAVIKFGLLLAVVAYVLLAFTVRSRRSAQAAT
jgi:hypothetical protein